MRLLLYISAALLSLNSPGQDSPPPLDQLVKEVDALSPEVSPQQIFDTPEAKRLSDFIRVDVETNQAESTVRLLQQKQDTKPSWQVTVETVSRHGKAPTSKDITSLESMFKATIKEGDHWLNYSPPRGWTSPYQFRDKLAKLILFARTGAPQDIEDRVLLRDNPSRWLSQLNPPPTESATQAATKATRKESHPSAQPPALKKAPSTPQTTSTSSEETTSSTPWSIIVVLIVAGCGLLWLVLKRRS